MNDLIMLVPVFIIGLVIFIMVDLKKTYKSQPPTLETLMEDIQEKATQEIRNKLIFYYGNQKLQEKNLNNYEDLYKEMISIERNNQC